MSEVDARGPQVDPYEDLYRAIHVSDWWDQSFNPPRVRSSAFSFSKPFSVNIASIIGLEGAIRHMIEILGKPQGGIVSFNCGNARTLGFDARHEPDPNYPDNKAHANVYYDGSNNSRKRAARLLADQCQTVHEPRFQS
ncbi:MAG TPA: hypothetical protein VIH42_15375 [Thermoguttaceae bacterium]